MNFIASSASNKYSSRSLYGRLITTKQITRKLVDTRYIDTTALNAIHDDIFALLKIPSHPSIESVYGVIIHTCDDATPIKYSIITQHVNGNSLASIIRSKTIISRLEATKIVVQIADALAHLHRFDSVHGDLRLDTVIVADDNIVLIDGGLDSSTRATVHLRMYNSRTRRAPWIAPESFIIGERTKESDLFSLGVIMWSIASHKEPFIDVPEINLCIKHHTLVPPPPNRMSKKYIDVMNMCLNVNPELRPTAINVSETLLKDM